MASADITVTLDTRPSVQPAWCRSLSLQQQSVLFLAGRGPDGITKAHPCKDIQRAYRGTILIAAKFNRQLNWGEKGDSFMSLDLMVPEGNRWSLAIDRYFEHADSLPHHFQMHLMHGAEIIGYKHPDARFRDAWLQFYARAIGELHLERENAVTMDSRLGDWGRIHWTDRPDLSSKLDNASRNHLQNILDEDDLDPEVRFKVAELLEYFRER